MGIVGIYGLLPLAAVRGSEKEERLATAARRLLWGRVGAEWYGRLRSAILVRFGRLAHPRFPHRSHSLTPSERRPYLNLRGLFKYSSGKRAGAFFLANTIHFRRA
jgi:hypothetical protein